MMILYQFPGGDGLTSVSPPCVRVEMALRRCGAEYRTKDVRSRADARKYSVTGRLPMLEIDGQRISDSIEILDELERRFPDSGLSPDDEAARLQDRLWEHYFNDHVYYVGFYLRWVDDENRERFMRALLGRAPWLLRVVAPTLLRREARQRARAIGLAGKSRETIDRCYRRSLEMMETGLGSGPFLQGRDQPGRGDLAGASMLAQVGFRGTMPDWKREAERHPAVLDHVRRVFDACSMERPRWLAR